MADEQEPLYHFVKGKGWVVTTIESVDVIIGTKQYRIFNRLPELDEYFYSIGKGSWVDENYNGFVGHCKWIANDRVSPSPKWNYSYGRSHYMYAVTVL